MAFQPQVNQELVIEGVAYRITEHPAAPGVPYGQEGRQGIVFQLAHATRRQALKAFNPRYRVPSLVAISKRLGAYAALPGLQVCQRVVLNPLQHPELLRDHPDLVYAVLMPWVEGPTWFELVLERSALSPEQSLALARSFAHVLTSMEQEGLAHCDLSGPNVLIPLLARAQSPHDPERSEAHASRSDVALVDVEQMYGPELRRPESLVSGSFGYAHKTIDEGVWSAEADRFAGAVLLAEMLAWCDERVREAAWGESYFDPEETQQPCPRHDLMVAVLRERWGSGPADLFEQAWASGALDHCPSFADWLVRLPTSVPAATVTSQVAVDAAAELPHTAASDAAVRELMLIASRDEAEGNVAGALAAYHQALALLPVGSALWQEVGLIVRNLESRSQTASEPPKSTYSTPLQSPAPPVPQPAPATPPPLPTTVPSTMPASPAQVPAKETEAEATRLAAPVAAAPAVPPGAAAVAGPVVVEPSAARRETEAAKVHEEKPNRNWLVVPAMVLIALLAFGGIAWSKLSAGAPTPGPAPGPTPTVEAGVPGSQDPTATAVPQVAGQQVIGRVRFHDATARLDQVTLSVEGMPRPPEGRHYEAWLLGAGGERRQTLGVLNLDSNGNGQLDYRDGQGNSLLGRFTAAEITIEPQGDTNPLASGEVAFSVALPTEATLHIGHLLLGYDLTPGNIALAIGLLQSTEALNSSVQEMRTASQEGDLPRVKRLAEGVVNLIEGENGEHYGDLDGDQAVTDPGDKFGLLPNGDNPGYVQDTIEHARLSMNSADATTNIKLHAEHVIVSANNMAEWSVELRDIAQRILAADSAEAASNDVVQAVSLADRLLNGRDLNGNEQVDPVPGEGAAKTVHQHAYYMADMIFSSDGTGEGGAPSHNQGGESASTATVAHSVLPTSNSEPATPTTEPAAQTAPEPAGRLVFEDNFDEGPGKSGLEDEGRGTESSRGFHSPGVYHLKLSSPDEALWVVLPRLAFADFSVQIEMWDNSDEFTGDVVGGIIFRVRDSDHFYSLLLNPRNGHYSVRKRDGANDTELIAAQSSSLIKRKAEVNHIRLDANGNLFTIYLNDRELDSFEDETYSFGKLGMISVNQGAVQPHMHFDNLKVWSSDPPAQEGGPPRFKEDPAGNMILMPAGEFIMGGTDRSDEKVHIVHLPDYYIDQHEVTNAAYARCVAQGKCSPQRSQASETHPNYAADPQYSQFPVLHVSWQQALEFCAWANKRLPTEAEWEKAASWNATIREKKVWPWGNEFDAALLNSAESGRGDVVAVGKFPVELNGTFDMAGNAWEWTNSLNKPYPYDPGDGREDPQAAGERVFRGGSWAQTMGKARTFFRQAASPTYADGEIGFRCAATPGGE